MNTKGLIPKTWRLLKRIFIILFIGQFVYIVILKWVNPPVTITQLVSLITGHGLRRDYVDYDEISPNLRLAVIASEDQIFPDHSGFDWKSIEKAMAYNKRKPNRVVHGGSTISQQVAKNVFLWQGRDYIRKGLEVYFTFMIEKIWGKRRIMDVYLNVIEMGDGIFGAEKAAQTYFNKPAKNLTKKEAAMIAACLPNPKVFTVKPPHEKILNKYPTILRNMNILDSDPDIQRVMASNLKK